MRPLGASVAGQGRYATELTGLGCPVTMPGRHCDHLLLLRSVGRRGPPFGAEGLNSFRESYSLTIFASKRQHTFTRADAGSGRTLVPLRRGGCITELTGEGQAANVALVRVEQTPREVSTGRGRKTREPRSVGAEWGSRRGPIAQWESGALTRRGFGVQILVGLLGKADGPRRCTRVSCPGE